MKKKVVIFVKMMFKVPRNWKEPPFGQVMDVRRRLSKELNKTTFFFRQAICKFGCSCIESHISIRIEFEFLVDGSSLLMF